MTTRLQLVGTQRSGSNLLRLIVGAAANAVAPPSAHELSDLADIDALDDPFATDEQLVQVIADIRGLIDCNALVWPPIAASDEDIAQLAHDRTLAGAVAAIYDALAFEQGADVWMSKCLENVHYYERLAASGVQLKFVHLVRDPRDVALSFARAPIGPKEPHIIGRQWVEDQIAAEAVRMKVSPDRWHTIRYEDLVTAPVPTVKALFRFANLDDDDTVFDFHCSDEARRAVGLSALWANLDRPIDASLANKYVLHPDTNFLAAVESVTSAVMQRYGYTPQFARLATTSEGQYLEWAAQDRLLRSKFAAERDPDREAIHLRRVAYLDALRARERMA